MTTPKPGRPVSPSVYYLLSNAWGLAIGALALVAAFLFVVLPSDLTGDPVVSRQLGAWDDLYYFGYGTAGACIVGGIIGRNRALDAFGLSVLAAAVAIAFVALASVLGPRALISAPSTLALMFGAIGRLLVVARFVRPEPPERLSIEDFERRHGRA